MSLRELEDVARRCVPGVGPVEVQPLTTGLVNETYRVLRNGRLYSLRVAAERSVDLGLDRTWECRVLKIAAAAGLAPVIEHCDPGQRVLVAVWVAGHAMTAEQIRRPETIEAMAELLRRVHSLPQHPGARGMTPGAWVADYSAALARRGLDESLRTAELRGAMMAHLALLAATPSAAPVLCHGDLHRMNVLVGERTVLLDWEFAHVTDRFWDLAGWIATNDWSEEAATSLLASYLRRLPDSNERARLAAFGWLYDYVCLLWSDLYLSQRCGRGSEEVAERAELLERRLRPGSGGRAR